EGGISGAVPLTVFGSSLSPPQISSASPNFIILGTTANVEFRGINLRRLAQITFLRLNPSSVTEPTAAPGTGHSLTGTDNILSARVTAPDGAIPGLRSLYGETASSQLNYSCFSVVAAGPWKPLSCPVTNVAAAGPMADGRILIVEDGAARIFDPTEG